MRIKIYVARCSMCSKIVYGLNERQVKANITMHYKIVHNTVPENITVEEKEVEV